MCKEIMKLQFSSFKILKIAIKCSMSLIDNMNFLFQLIKKLHSWHFRFPLHIGFIEDVDSWFLNVQVCTNIQFIQKLFNSISWKCALRFWLYRWITSLTKLKIFHSYLRGCFGFLHVTASHNGGGFFPSSSTFSLNLSLFATEIRRATLLKVAWMEH
jgi:hypothetical protein